MILKDLLRYTAKAEQHTGRLEQAIEMIMDLKKQADDLSTLDRITGYPGDLSLLGPIYRHVSQLLSLCFNPFTFYCLIRQEVLLSREFVGSSVGSLVRFLEKCKSDFRDI